MLLLIGIDLSCFHQSLHFPVIVVNLIKLLVCCDLARRRGDFLQWKRVRYLCNGFNPQLDESNPILRVESDSSTFERFRQSRVPFESDSIELVEHRLHQINRVSTQPESVTFHD